MKLHFLQGENSLVGKFRIQHFFIWNFSTIFYNFAIPFFEDKGLDPTLIPIALAVSIVTGIIGRFIWGYIVDRTQALKKTYMALMAVTLLVIWSSALVNSVPVMFLMMGTLGLVEHPFGSILDSWILRKFKGREGAYNSIRFFGSIGFTSFSIIYGLMVGHFGWIVIYICSLATTGILEFAAFFTADISKEQKQSITSELHQQPRKKLSILPLLKNYRLVLLSFIGLFTIFSCAPSNSFMIRFMEFKGGNVSIMGTAFALSAIGEIPIFIFYNRVMTKISPLVRLIIANAMFFMVYFLTLFTPGITLTLIALVFHGAGYAIFLPTLRFCAIEMAPKGLETSAMTISEAVYFGLSLILAFPIFGWIIASFGMAAALKVSLIILSSMMLVLFVWYLTDKKARLEKV